MRRIVLLLLAAGCRQLFGLEPPALATADASSDGTVPDAGPCIAASTQCLGDVLRVCSGPGATAVDTMCAWGCLDAGGPHCGELVPGGDGAVASDLEPDTMVMDIALGGSGVLIDTDTGAIGTGSAAESIRAAGPGVNNGIGYTLHNGIAVFRFASLTLSTGVAPFGSHAVALVAAGAIDVSGVITTQATCVANGGTLGGFAGGAASTSATGSGGGTGAPAPTDGGGGGGYGGAGGLGAGNIAGGSRYGDSPITLLIGGGGGGGGGNAAGGAGGGAIQLASNTRISIAGGINAGGCGGKSVSGFSGAGGGGAGGTILLEAPLISIPGKLAVNGGGGGGTGTATTGTNGTLDRVPAAGATGNGNGGNGAAASMLDGATATGIEGGGGGGGIGRIRLNTRSGAANVSAAAVLSPSLTDPASTCTQGMAVVQ